MLRKNWTVFTFLQLTQCGVVSESSFVGMDQLYHWQIYATDDGNSLNISNYNSHVNCAKRFLPALQVVFCDCRWSVYMTALEKTRSKLCVIVKIYGVIGVAELSWEVYVEATIKGAANSWWWSHVLVKLIIIVIIITTAIPDMVHCMILHGFLIP